MIKTSLDKLREESAQSNLTVDELKSKLKNYSKSLKSDLKLVDLAYQNLYFLALTGKILVSSLKANKTDLEEMQLVQLEIRAQLLSSQLDRIEGEKPAKEQQGVLGLLLENIFLEVNEILATLRALILGRGDDDLGRLVKHLKETFTDLNEDLPKITSGSKDLVIEEMA